MPKQLLGRFEIVLPFEIGESKVLATNHMIFLKFKLKKMQVQKIWPNNGTFSRKHISEAKCSYNLLQWNVSKKQDFMKQCLTII